MSHIMKHYMQHVVNKVYHVLFVRVRKCSHCNTKIWFLSCVIVSFRKHICCKEVSLSTFIFSDRVCFPYFSIQERVHFFHKQSQLLCMYACAQHLLRCWAQAQLLQWCKACFFLFQTMSEFISRAFGYRFRDHGL